MGRRWRKRTYIKEIVISPEEVARRKAQALQANAEIADIQIPQLKAALAQHRAIIEQFAHSRGVPIEHLPVLREQLSSRQLLIRKAEEEAQEGARRAQQRITAARREIERITESDKRSQGILRRIFLGYTPSPEAVSRVDYEAVGESSRGSTFFASGSPCGTEKMASRGSRGRQ